MDNTKTLQIVGLTVGGYLVFFQSPVGPALLATCGNLLCRPPVVKPPLAAYVNTLPPDKKLKIFSCLAAIHQNASWAYLP